MTKTKEHTPVLLAEELKAARAEQKKLRAIEKRRSTLEQTFTEVQRLVALYGSAESPSKSVPARTLKIPGIHMKNDINALIELRYEGSGENKIQVIISFSDRRIDPQHNDLLTRNYKLVKSGISWGADGARDGIYADITDPKSDAPIQTVTQILTLARRTMRLRQHDAVS